MDGRVGEDGGELGQLLTTHAQVQDLGLIDEVLYTLRTDPGAKNRFIYYPDQLNRLPSEMPTFTSMLALYRTGLLAGTFGTRAWMDRLRAAKAGGATSPARSVTRAG